MSRINKEDVIVLENDSGGKVALVVQQSYSSRILYKQVATNGSLDFSKRGDNIMKRSEFQHYNIAKFETIKQGKEVVMDDEKELKGYSDILEQF